MERLDGRIEYEVIKNEIIITSFYNKNVAIEYAKENNCDSIVKYDNFNIETLGVVWEK